MADNTVAFTITVPIRDIDSNDVLNAFAKAYGYQDTVLADDGTSVANPVSREEFAEDCVAAYILGVTKSYLVDKAILDARNSALGEATSREADVTAWFAAQRAARNAG